MFSDRLVEALRRLNTTDAENVKRFKRAIRSCFDGLLRFSHRCWFHEVAEQTQSRALFCMCATHIEFDVLYAEVKARIHDMSAYLKTGNIRRQVNAVVRLTVVTILALIGTLALTVYTMTKSKRPSDFLDAAV